MSTIGGITEIERYRTGRGPCSYLWHETASLECRVISDITSEAYRDLLQRGWRRFGRDFFRPACPRCTKCRSLRIKIREFAPSRSQRRAVESNQHVEVVVQPLTISPAHVKLYNDYHLFMHAQRGWRLGQTTKQEYATTFLAGNFAFAREILYFDARKLVGVALIDLVPGAVSSVYFFHDPAWRPKAPGVFSVLQTLKVGQDHDLEHQ